MAMLLAPAGWEEGSLATTLRDRLGDDYWVVAGATVRGREPEALVVGPQGLFTLRTSRWTGGDRPEQPVRRPEGLPRLGASRQDTPLREAELDERALRAFLRDEFPALQVPIHCLAIPAQPQQWPAGSEIRGPRVVTQGSVVAAITATPAYGQPLGGEVREALAFALHERRLTATERAREPFVFRAGGGLGSGKKVWTVRAAVKHIDRHPEDGAFHLLNGTLARWLEAQGAGHLATLARAVLGQRETEPRALVEGFLIGTGLVRRPRLVVRPPVLNLGFVLSGEACRGRVRLSKGRGRGYLFGMLHTRDPWLHVEPTSFRGGPVDALVSADTGTLPISQKPWRADVVVESSASAEPQAIPVRVRVVGMPSALNRRLARPLIGALAAGALGAGLGWALGRWALGVPAWLAGIEWRPAEALAAVSPSLFWMAVVGLFWAVLGAARGWRQPPHWPIGYATARWLLRTLAWTLAVATLALVGHGSWVRFGPDAATGVAPPSLAAVMLAALVVSIVPAVVGEVRSGQRPAIGQAQPGGGSRFLRRPLTLTVAGLALLVVVVVAVPLLGRALQGVDLKGMAGSAQGWIVERWSRLEAGVDDWVDRMILRTYERGAPSQGTPAPTPTATQGPTPAATAAGP